MTHSLSPRGRLLVLLLGLTLGLAVGLTYTWVVSPVQLVNTAPHFLREDYRADWVRLAALSYVADGDLERARARLSDLDREEVAAVLGDLLEAEAAAGRPSASLSRLAALAQEFGARTPAIGIYLRTPEAAPTHVVRSTPTATPSPAPTATPRPTRPPTATPYPFSPLATPTAYPTFTPLPPTPTPEFIARLRVVKQEQLCDGQGERIEVVVQDEQGRGVPGVEVWLTWPGGADRAVTGLKPQFGAGYADFAVERGVGYALGVGELGRPLVDDLRISLCPSGGGGTATFGLFGSWRVVLQP